LNREDDREDNLRSTLDHGMARAHTLPGQHTDQIEAHTGAAAAQRGYVRAVWT
jgi:hypothetical protein